MERNRVLEAHETVPQFLELYRTGLAGDPHSLLIIRQRYPRLVKMIHAYDQALALADTPLDAENVAPCRLVALRAAQDLSDRILGKPKEHVEVSGLADFQTNLTLAIKIEAKIKAIEMRDKP